MYRLLPGECLDGTTAQQHHLRSRLTQYRSDPQPAPLPGITFRPLPDVLASGLADLDLFRAGYEITRQRCHLLGIPLMLPLSRVFTGITADAVPGSTGCSGGFHHPGQGYRHLQMTATITVYGDLLTPVPASPQAIALDLVRSYAHDCLHYGTYRRYQLTPAGEIARVQHGINFRHLDGRTYSAPDPPHATSTRNLGIVMEGATDTEATAIARRTAITAGLDHMDGPPSTSAWAFADTTGILQPAAIEQANRSANRYLKALGGFACAVTRRYQTLLTELADDHGQLHQLILTAMINGNLTGLKAWLNHDDDHQGEHQHLPDCFSALFQARTWDGDRLAASA